jgi:hypothetical protein
VASAMPVAVGLANCASGLAVAECHRQAVGSHASSPPTLAVLGVGCRERVRQQGIFCAAKTRVGGVPRQGEFVFAVRVWVARF